MYELKTDPFYDFLKKYPRAGVEHCLIADDAPYSGESSHRKALEFALRVFSERLCPEEPFTCEIEKAAVKAIPAEKFFVLPPKDWKKVSSYKGLEVIGYDRVSDGGPIPYWKAFIDPPHGSNYTGEDVDNAYSALFPVGRNALEILEWSTDWSDFFDDGHEWWGASCWSIYDRKLQRFAVIMASDTD